MQNHNLAVTTEPAEAEALRANLYRLLARLLARPADEALLAMLQGLSGDDSPLGRGIGDLAGEARAIRVPRSSGQNLLQNAQGFLAFDGDQDIAQSLAGAIGGLGGDLPDPVRGSGDVSHHRFELPKGDLHDP